MAALLGDKNAVKAYETHIADLSKHLDSFWAGNHYAYRDRDTNITTSGTMLLESGAGDIEHILKRPLAAPNRVIVHIIGGVNHVPNITLQVDGFDANGDPVTEIATSEKFLWQNRQGIYTTQTVFSRVEKLRCEGLARVYRIDVRTMDTTNRDINAVLPLISGVVPAAKAKKLVNLALNKKHFLRPNGITMTDAATSTFDPGNAEGAGGLWLYWQTLIGEALIAAGQGSKVADIMKSILKMLQDVLSQEHEFAQFYNSDLSVGLGEKDQLTFFLWRGFPYHSIITCAGVAQNR
jgi:hypothetical protein